jgi:retron-type reverse transcriptase
MLTTPETIRTLQRKLYRKAKQEPACRFHALYDKVYRADILGHAYALVRASKGSAGIDGVTFAAIEEKEGAAAFIAELEEALRNKTYKPDSVKRVLIPKNDGSQRPLGIPTIRDRVAQMAVKLVIEPIFEADFCETSYGFRPRKSAHDAVDAVTYGLNTGFTEVIDADLSKYFDTIPHANLMAVVAERICDGAILHLIQMWLKSPVVEQDKDGTKRNIGGGRDNRKGTPPGRGDLPVARQSLSAHSGQDMGAARPAKTAGRTYRPLCGRYCHSLPERQGRAGHGCVAADSEAAGTHPEHGQDQGGRCLRREV